MSTRTRILQRRAKFIAAAITLSCGGTAPTDAGPEDAAIHDGSPDARKDAGSDAEEDALVDAAMDALKDTGPQPCLAPM